MRTNRPPINGEVIQTARMRKGMTQEDVQRACAELGVPVWNISRMENGETRWPSPKALVVIAEVLDLNVTDFFAAAA